MANTTDTRVRRLFQLAVTRDARERELERAREERRLEEEAAQTRRVRLYAGAWGASQAKPATDTAAATTQSYAKRARPGGRIQRCGLRLRRVNSHSPLSLLTSAYRSLVTPVINKWPKCAVHFVAGNLAAAREALINEVLGYAAFRGKLGARHAPGSDARHQTDSCILCSERSSIARMPPLAASGCVQCKPAFAWLSCSVPPRRDQGGHRL